MAGIQFPKPLAYLAHGDMQRALYMDTLVLRGFPHVQQDAVGAVLSQESLGFSRGDLRYARHGSQNLKTRGLSAFLSGGRSVSNRLSRVQASSAVRVTSKASITGAWPTTTQRRPPTLRRCS